MHYTKFEIKNYKGISRLIFNLSQAGDPAAYSLIGLNESGKTTILEAISFMVQNLTQLDEISLYGPGRGSEHDYIPKNKKSNFNDNVVVTASATLSADDIVELKKHLLKLGYEAKSIEPLVIFGTGLNYKNSVFSHSYRHLSISITGRQAGKRKYAMLPNSNKNPYWKFALDWIDEHAQPIIYYPNFLFDFPDKIYIEQFSGESKEQVFYRHFLQDVLDSFENGFKLPVHVTARAKSESTADKEALDATLNKMSSKMTSLVFNKDFSVLRGDTSNKSVSIAGPYLDKVKNAYYVQIRLRDGEDTYFIRERSLGFRWFFTFLLLTQFRLARSKGTMPFFLFDEPASNLHAAAQQRLRTAIGKLVDKTSASVIYATHSHHLIEPKWLGNTYIVRNSATEATDADDFLHRATDITIQKYRDFVSKNPSQTSYFQPILDVLEYRPSNLELLPNVTIVEGKNDFYTLKYMAQLLGRDIDRIAPATSASNMDTLISLYYAWGKEFLVILDGDQEGVKQKQRYLSEFGPAVVQNRIFTLGDICPIWTGYAMEGLISLKDKETILSSYSNIDGSTKKRLNRAIQEAIVTGHNFSLSEETISNFIRILDFIDAHSPKKSSKHSPVISLS